MSARDLFLALLVVVVWGCNFIFIKLSLEEIPPFLLCALRFFLASFPAVFFIRLPYESIKMIASYGFIMFGLQFSLMFLGMKLGMTPGLASLLIQVQIFFSIFFAACFLDEMPGLTQIVGALVSFAGIGVVAMHIDNTVSLSGFILIILAAASWGVGNLITKKMQNVKVIPLIVWGSFFAFFPLLLLSFIFEGFDRMVFAFHHVTYLGGVSVLYIVYASTWIGYGVWSKLINQYPVVIVVPFTLLVPVVGMLSSALVLDESLPFWKILAGLLVITGLCINLLGAQFFEKKIHSSSLKKL